jgi:hypothetical protein
MYIITSSVNHARCLASFTLFILDRGIIDVSWLPNLFLFHFLQRIKIHKYKKELLKIKHVL